MNAKTGSEKFDRRAGLRKGSRGISRMVHDELTTRHWLSPAHNKACTRRKLRDRMGMATFIAP